MSKKIKAEHVANIGNVQASYKQIAGYLKKQHDQRSTCRSMQANYEQLVNRLNASYKP